MQLLLLKVRESFRFWQIKKLEVYFGLYEPSFSFIDERGPNKYCSCEVNLISYMLVFSLMDQVVNLARKLAVSNVGCVFVYFCGGHKNNFPIWFRSSFKVKQNFQKNKVVTGKTPFSVILCESHFVVIVLFVVTLASDMAVLYENDAFFILSAFN